MNYKKIFKRETKVIAYIVICLTLVVIGASYALFLQVNNNSNYQVVTAGSLVITYGDGNEVTALDSEGNCLTPQSDSEGSSGGGCNFKLSIINQGTLPMQYNLLIYDNTTDAPSDATFVDKSLVKYSLNKQYTEAAKSESVASGNTLSSLKDYDDPDAKEGDPTKKVIETSVIDAGETITFSLNIWLDEDSDTDIIGQYVYLKLDVDGIVYETEAASATLLSDMGTNGISEVLDDSTTYTSSTIKEYRYTGANPNNYIYYNCTDLSDVSTCEVWRILGIYNVNNESRIKIINTNSNTSYAWDTNGGSSFNTSTLNSYLNGDYYNSLSTDARNQIENATYYLGGADSLDINSKEMYGDEKTATEYISTNVGLMTLSDYSFASGINDTTLISGISSLNASNWLYKGLDEWLINKDSSGAVYYIASDGSISTGTVTSEYLIRPVVYLASNIKITGGNGSSASPYQLSK